MHELLPGISLHVCTDRTSARIAIDPSVDLRAAGIDPPTLIAALEAAGLARTRLDEDAITAALAGTTTDADPGSDAAPNEHTIAQGSPVRHGRDARVDIEPHLADQLERQRAVLTTRPGSAARADVTDNCDVSHYEVNAFCVVSPGEVVGRFHPAEPGEDGIDVFGKVIGAREGRDTPIKLLGVTRDATGTITAEHAGLLTADAECVSVSEELAIPGAVDFTTGHLRFPGDADVGDGVRDMFQVRVGGTLTVRDLVEAATLCAGEDIVLERGMAGRGKGTAEAGRDLRARYLDGVTGSAGRDLAVENEITACELAVGRRVCSPNATMVSGIIRAAEGVELGEIGSAARANAGVFAGSAPKVEQTARALLELAPRVLAEVAAAEERLATLRSIGGKMSPSQAEELTELEFAVAAGRGRMEPIARAMLRAATVLDACRRATITIHRTAHPGARLGAGGQEALLTRAVEGPVRIEPSGTHARDLTVVDAQTGASVPLATLAETTPREDAVDLEALAARVDELAPGLAERFQAERAARDGEPATDEPDGGILCGDTGARRVA